VNHCSYPDLVTQSALLVDLPFRLQPILLVLNVIAKILQFPPLKRQLTAQSMRLSAPLFERSQDVGREKVITYTGLIRFFRRELPLCFAELLVHLPQNGTGTIIISSRFYDADREVHLALLTSFNSF